MTTDITVHGNQVVAVLDGRLDTSASIQFAEDIKPLLEQADKDIVLDFTDLSFISSSGLRILLTLRKEVSAKGGEVTIKGMNSDIQQVFTITGFTSFFKFC